MCIYIYMVNAGCKLDPSRPIPTAQELQEMEDVSATPPSPPPLMRWIEIALSLSLSHTQTHTLTHLLTQHSLTYAHEHSLTQENERLMRWIELSKKNRALRETVTALAQAPPFHLQNTHDPHIHALSIPPFRAL